MSLTVYFSKATYAYNAAVPGKPAVPSPYTSTTQNYINAQTRPIVPQRPPINLAPPMEEQQYQARCGFLFDAFCLSRFYFSFF